MRSTTGRRQTMAGSRRGKAKPDAQRPRAARSRRQAEPGSPRRLIYLLSDSTGNLAKHMLTAFLTQFPPGAFTLRQRTFLEDPNRLAEALEEIEREPGIIFHAVVSDRFKRMITRRCSAAKVPACDLTGGFVQFLARKSGLKPAQDTRRLHHVDETYKRRINAIDFALQHDDGLGLETIHEADVVLSGVSRTSKTPTSIYLAQQGYKVANVSLAIQVEPPRELLSMPPHRVVGLIIDAQQLVEIRRRRQMEWGMPETSYNSPEAVERELAWSRALFRRQGWALLNVTDQAVEETAGRILTLVGLPRAT